jgi:biopolymer transport protein ExbD
MVSSMLTNGRELAVFTVSGLVCACACRAPAQSESHGAAEHSRSAALSGPKASALQRCNAARENARRAIDAGGEPSQALASVTTSCADLYAEAGCANAFRKAMTVPVEARAASIALACRDAYCPRLADPKPALCASNEPVLPSRLLAVWPELDMRILSLELNVSLEEVARLLPRPAAPAAGAQTPSVALPVPRASADDDGGASVVVVSLGFDAGGNVRVWVDEEPPEMLPAKPDASSFAGVAARASKHAATRVVIAADARAPHGDVVALIDALKQVGIMHVAVQVSPATEPLKGSHP